MLSPPAGNFVTHREASARNAILPLMFPRMTVAAMRVIAGLRLHHPASTTTTAPPIVASKCRRPVVRPAPYARVKRIGARSLIRALRLLPFQLASASAASRCNGDLAERLHNNNLDCGTALLFFQTHLCDDRAFAARDIAWRDPVECEGQHVVPAELASTVGRKQRPERVVGRSHMIFDQVLDHSTAS
jgi:hypothetical protein